MARASEKQTDVQRIQNSLLIWLDSSVDETSCDYKNTLTHLHRVAYSINTFKIEGTCIEFIKEQAQEKVNIIVSDLLGPTFIPCIHNMSQVHGIFIFCNNDREEGWMRIWPKILGLFTDIESLCQALRETAKTCEQNCVSFSLIKTKDESSENFDQLEPLFMYTQLIKEIILSIKFEQKHIDQYFEYCRNVFKENESELINVNDIAKHYQLKSAIWWYTKESFLYPMLNRALRLTDTDIILKIAFFIKALDQELEQLHRKEFRKTSSSKLFTVYRGQSLSEEDLEKIRKTKDGLIAFNNFLSTSKRREVSVAFALSSLQRNPAIFGVLYVMNIDPKKATNSFASIESVSAVKGEDEVLFSMNSVFRIENIVKTEEHERLYEVNLTLTNEDDRELRKLTNHIRQQNYPTEQPWFRLGFLVQKMGHVEKAKQIFQNLLDQTDNDQDKSVIYFELAAAQRANGEYKEALALYAKALLIQRRLHSPDHIFLAPIYHNIGWVYYDLSDFPKALDYYKKALEIRKKSLPSSHRDLGMSYNNIAGIYEKMGDNKSFREYSEKALKIEKRSLPSNDPDLGKSYVNIGLQHYNTGDYRKALDYYKQALEIQKKSLTPYHPDLAMCYNNMAGVHQAMGDYKSALEYMEKAHDIRKHSLPPDHPEMGMSHNNMGFVYERTGDYSKARSCFKIAVDIGKKCLPPNHPYRHTWEMNFERVSNQ